MHASPSSNADQGPLQPLPGARTALALLLAINLFNYIDRQVLAGVLPKIEEAFLRGDPNSKTKLGWLTTAFLVAYMVLSPLFGWLGDRMARWLLVGVGVILWSLASGASGLAEGYLMLFLTRCLVGVGEAAYGPTAPGVISDMFPVSVRGSKLAWFYAAIPVGGALGYVLGGTVADSALGWRWAFYLVVPPGLLLGILCFLMKEPPRGASDVGSGGHRVARSEDYWMLLRTPSYVLNTLGMTALTFAVGGIAVWMPTYIYEREARWEITAEVVKDLSTNSPVVPEATLAKLKPMEGKVFLPATSREEELDGPVVAELSKFLRPAESKEYKDRILDAARTPRLGPTNILFGAIVVISGFAATLLGGIVGDRLRPRYSGSYFLVSALSMMIGFPMILMVAWTPFPLAWVFIFLAVFSLFFNTGPTNTILANVVHPAVRASAFALNIFVIHALGDVVSPVLMGWIWDMPGLTRPQGRDWALITVSAVVLVGGVLWGLGIKHLQRDTELAPRRLDYPDH